MGIGLVNLDVSQVMQGIGELAKDVRQAVTGKDPEAESKSLALTAAIADAQAKINLAEASNPNVFVSGWRPFIGWLCGIGIGIQFIYMPIFNPDSRYDFSELLNLVIAMLGIGALRTYEKIQGVSK